MEKENKKLGGATGKGFGVSEQPSPEAKKEGWERRQRSQRMMETLEKYMNMPLKAFEKIINDIERHPKKHTVEEKLLAHYAKKAMNGDRFMLDWMDRNISKAPQDVDVKSGGEKVQGVIVEFVTKQNEDPNAGNERSPEESGS